MAKIFKPRRGKKSTMAGTKKTTVLSAGEMFIEVPDTGAGTGHSKMKIGDGSTQYSSLPYAMGDTENDKIAFSNDTSGNITTALNKVTSGAALKTMIAALKQAVSLANTSITQLNDEQIDYGSTRANLQYYCFHTYALDINTDLNTVTRPGVYYVNIDSADNYKKYNYPYGGGTIGILNVMSSNSFIRQIYYRCGTIGSVEHNWFSRLMNMSYNQIGNWFKFLNEEVTQ